VAKQTFEERIAERQAKRAPLKEGAVFEHGPAKFLFITMLVLVIIVHVGALVVMMALGVH
jgi:hypothetical protein